MGNTMIQDSTTGNIMGLRDGFVPVGMKEYGGILYIASFNPQTQEGQLGTIPSPVINYTYGEKPYINKLSQKVSNIDRNNDNTPVRDEFSKSLIDNVYPKYLALPFSISDKRFQVGDQFIVNLNFDNNIVTQRQCKYISNDTTLYTNTELEYRNYQLISGFKGENNINNYGWFKIVLEAKVEKSSDTINLSNISNKRQIYYIEDKLEPIVSNYWFINESEIPNKKIDQETGIQYIQLDTERCQADNQYRTYPNILPGYLYIHAEVELPENFEFFKNNSTGIKSPNVYLIPIQE